jgi:hypothetical protein
MAPTNPAYTNRLVFLHLLTLNNFTLNDDNSGVFVVHHVNILEWDVCTIVGYFAYYTA